MRAPARRPVLSAHGVLLPKVLEIAAAAGRAILEIYDTDFEVQAKEDESPLTAADLASHRAIVAGLKIYPTQARASAQLGQPGCQVQMPELPEVTAAFERRLAGCPDAEKPYLLAAYANVLRNRRELSLPSA